MRSVLKLLRLFCLGAVCGAAFGQDVKVRQTEANVMVELTLTASRTYADPFNDVAFDVAFTEPTGRELRVPAFWAGKNVWKVRYASPVLGTHTFRSLHADPADAGLHDASGTVEVKAYRGENSLYAHGALRVAANRRFIEHTDGKPFLWLGDTWWMGLCHRLHWPDEFKTLAADRRAKGFNVVQIVAGLYPDMPPFDPRGANEAGFPWEPDYARIRPEYFDAADPRIAHLVESEMVPCIVGAWGYFAPLMGVEKAKQHWRNLIARYGAWPVVWCIAGEANLPYYLTKGFPFDDRAQVKTWTEVARYVRAIDPFHRPITIHPTGLNRLSARNAIDDVALLDIDMLQTPHGEREAVAPTVRTVRESYGDQPVLPVINGEASYEMLNGKIAARWPRSMFWVCMFNGAAGHTYGANGIWQCNRRDQPHGASPHGGNYGTIPWDEAMRLPGSTQVGLGKALLAKHPWQKFEPHPEWAEFVDTAPLRLDGAEWIWFPEGTPSKDAPTEKRFFRKQFVIPDGRVITNARLRISADDRFQLFLNGRAVGQGADWNAGAQFDVAMLLQPGKNLIAIEAENLPSNVPANPAGLLFAMEIEFAGAAATLRLASDESWRCASARTAGWEINLFDDAGWRAALSLGKYGTMPWGFLSDGRAHSVAPQSAGIPGSVRMIYVPEPTAIAVHELDSGKRWSASYFDPVTGAMSAAPPVRADAKGSWQCPPPVDRDRHDDADDWVIVITSERTL